MLPRLQTLTTQFCLGAYVHQVRLSSHNKLLVDNLAFIHLTILPSIRGGMDSKGAHEFGREKGFSLIFGRTN